MNTINIEKKKCNFCGEDVGHDARRCPYCGSILGNRINEIRHEPEENLQNQPEAAFNGNADSNVQDDTGYKAEAEIGQDTQEADIMPTPEGAAKNPPVSDILKTHFDYYTPETARKPLGNGMKVFLTSLSTIIPGFGQIIGIIAAIVFLNADEDEDRKSFGKSLLISSLIVFVISLFTWVIIAMVISSILK